MTRVTPPFSFAAALAAVLGLGPFAIDMYLASLPDIRAEFTAPVWTTQLTLTGYLLMLGIGQLVAGPVTDAYGRRKPLLTGLVLFIAGSTLAALAPSMAVLVAARALQGAGGAISFVVANSSVRDRAEGNAATRIYAILMTVGAVAPILAPALGGVVDRCLGWRAVFICLAVLGTGALVGAIIALPESLPAQRRSLLRFAPSLRAYGALVTSGRFLVPLGALAGAFILLFCYLGGASYVYQGHYGVDQVRFGLIFGITGISALLGALTANLLANRLGTAGLARFGVILMTFGAAGALLGAWTDQPVAIIAAGIGVALLGLGAAEPALMGMCMSAVRDNLGGAAALIGATQYVLGSAASAAIATLAAAGPVPWTVPMLGISLVSLALLIPATRRRGQLPDADRYEPHAATRAMQ